MPAHKTFSLFRRRPLPPPPVSLSRCHPHGPRRSSSCRRVQARSGVRSHRLREIATTVGRPGTNEQSLAPLARSPKPFARRSMPVWLRGGWFPPSQSQTRRVFVRRPDPPAERASSRKRHSRNVSTRHVSPPFAGGKPAIRPPCWRLELLSGAHDFGGTDNLGLWTLYHPPTLKCGLRKCDTYGCSTWPQFPVELGGPPASRQRDGLGVTSVQKQLPPQLASLAASLLFGSPFCRLGFVLFNPTTPPATAARSVKSALLWP